MGAWDTLKFGLGGAAAGVVDYFSGGSSSTPSTPAAPVPPGFKGQRKDWTGEDPQSEAAHKTSPRSESLTPKRREQLREEREASLEQEASQHYDRLNGPEGQDPDYRGERKLLGELREAVTDRLRAEGKLGHEPEHTLANGRIIEKATHAAFVEAYTANRNGNSEPDLENALSIKIQQQRQVSASEPQAHARSPNIDTVSHEPTTESGIQRGPESRTPAADKDSPVQKLPQTKSPELAGLSESALQGVQRCREMVGYTKFASDPVQRCDLGQMAPATAGGPDSGKGIGR